MELPFQQEQLNFIIEIAKHRTALLDPIFLFLNYFDTPYFAAFLIPFVWFGFSYRTGLKVSYLFLASGILNSLLKYALDLPRPTVAMPEIGMLLFKSPGFPSGGAQTSFLLGALLIYRYRTLSAYALGIFYILLISFSRLYLGLHYPLDILGGWFAGCGLFLAFVNVEKPIDHWLEQQKNFSTSSLIIATIFSICLSVIYPLTGSILSLSVGALVALKYGLYRPSPDLFSQKLIRGTLAGLTTLLLCSFIPRTLPFYLLAIFLGLWISLGIPILLAYPRIHRN